MSSIQTGIELNDQFTGVIYSIINAVNLTVSTMEDMQQTMNADMDTSGIEGVRDEINQATMAMNELNAAMQNQPVINTDVPTVPQTSDTVEVPFTPEQSRSPPDPVEIPVTWNTDGLAVFTGTGIERFQQEVQSTNSMLEQLSSTQDVIARQAYNTNLFPPESFQDLNRLAVRIDTIRNRIQQIESNPVNIGTDRANVELERLRSQLNQAVQEQNELNHAMQNMDVSAANDAYLRLSQTVSHTERYIRDNVDEQGRFNQQIQAGTQQANKLAGMIKNAVMAYVGIQSVGKALEISDDLTQTMARLNLMNDGAQSTQELFDMIYVSAQETHSPLMATADAIAKMGNNAGGAFRSSAELVEFMEQVNKQFAIGGASATEQSNALMQLSQAMASGALRGDELNSILDAAPGIARTIEQSMGWAEGSIKSYAENGEVTAQVVKQSLLSMAEETNAAYESMPYTFSKAATDIQSGAIRAFQPVLEYLNDIADSQAFQNFVNGVIQAMAMLANIVLNVFDVMGTVGSFIADNWSIISPAIYGVIAALAVYAAYLGIVKGIELAAMAIKGIMVVALGIQAAAYMILKRSTWAAATAQYGLNGALYACPIVWIIILIIALIAVIMMLCNWIAEATGIANSGFGVMAGGINVVIQFIKNLGLTVANIALGIGNAIAALGSNIVTAFHNAICSVQAWWYDLLSDVLTVVSGICEALNKLPFVEFDYSGITSAANEYAEKSAEAAGNKEEYTSISDAFQEGFSTFDTFQEGWISDAFQAGAAWGDGIADKVSEFSLSDLFGEVELPNKDDYTPEFEGISDSLNGIAGNTSNISDAMDLTEEDLKYLRDIAEREAVNRYTVAEVSIDMSGMKNTVNSGTDLDGFMSGLTDAVNEAVDSITEGVHE